MHKALLPYPDAPEEFRGNGLPSLYICTERNPTKALGKVLACGGRREDLIILKSFGENEEIIDLTKFKHIQAIVNIILSNKLAYVIIDPLVDICLDTQNQNSFVRKKLTQLLYVIAKTNVSILGIMHLKKTAKTWMS